MAARPDRGRLVDLLVLQCAHLLVLHVSLVVCLCLLARVMFTFLAPRASNRCRGSEPRRMEES